MTTPSSLRSRPPWGAQSAEAYAVGLFVALGGPALD